jgi:hypothetical protein
MAKKLSKQPAPKKRTKRAKPAPRQTESTRGHHILLKDDVDAWKAGARSPRARRNARVVESAFNLRASVIRADQRMHERMTTVYGGYRDDGNGITINHPDGQRRVIFKKDHPISSNENAERASVILNEYLEGVIGGNSDDDERNFMVFISGIIQRNKAGIRYNSQIKKFLLMQFRNPVLREAQRLLADGFEARESKLKIYCQVWNEEDKEWVSQ